MRQISRRLCPLPNFDFFVPLNREQIGPAPRAIAVEPDPVTSTQVSPLYRSFIVHVRWPLVQATEMRYARDYLT